MCDSCNFKSESLVELSFHRQSHFCHLCGLFIQKPSLMNNHMIKVHNYKKFKNWQVKKFHCKICKNIYSSAGSLYNHKNRAHSTLTCSCEICGQIFSHKSFLSNHMQRHQSRKALCSECPAKFYLASELNKHINQVHRKIKPYECPKCGKYFCQRTVLNHHLSQHMPVDNSCIQNGNDGLQSTKNFISNDQDNCESPFVTFVLELHSKNIDYVEIDL